MTREEKQKIFEPLSRNFETENIKAYFIGKITPTYLYYSDYKYPKTTYYRCTLKTKQVITLSQSAYLNKIK